LRTNAGPARTFIVVPAAGTGERFGSGTAKQYADLNGAPVLARTLDRLGTIPCERTFVVLAIDDGEYEKRIGRRDGIEVIRCGGASRAATVRNAIEALTSHCVSDDWILVHDAVRPCVPRDTLARLVREIADDAVGGLLAIPVADTLKRVAGDRAVNTENRESLWQAQTPQMFRYSILVTALNRDKQAAFTDEAQAVELLAATGACAPPRSVRGSTVNLKITYPEDLALATAILAMQK
jgi:2-C-methyl-D-erythritol 4-phosphate cytidylyltransferase